MMNYPENQIAGANTAFQQKAYSSVNEAPPENGLLRLANQIELATSRVEVIASNLTSVAHGIHGPRPEPVSTGQNAGVQTGGDSFAIRISHLSSAIERLERAYESVVR